MKKNVKSLIFYLFIALLTGGVGYLLAGNTKIYDEITKPAFAPPGIVFPIVWTILYILMGISSYLVSKEKDSDYALKIYYTQLVFNLFWPLFFFRLKWFLFSAIWLVALLIFVIYMTILFYRKKKIAGLIQIPYCIWCSFALLLNIAIYILN